MLKAITLIIYTMAFVTFIIMFAMALNDLNLPVMAVSFILMIIFGRWMRKAYKS